MQLDDLLKKANFTVSVAKEKGGNNLSMFNATDYSKHQRDLKLQEKLRLAIKNNYEGFQIFYQPVVDAKNIYLDSDKTITNVIGAEGLMRYSCPEFGVVSPEEFKEMFFSREITIEEFIYIEGHYDDIISMVIVMWTLALGRWF